jgi:hypothetical protein
LTLSLLSRGAIVDSLRVLGREIKLMTLFQSSFEAVILLIAFLACPKRA